MECLLGGTKEDIADCNSREKEDHLQTLKVLHFNAVEIWFIQSELFQTLKKCHGDIWLLALATRVWGAGRLAM